MKKITLSQLAKQAQVSTTSLTRYLKKEKVGEDIAKRIQIAIKESGYEVEEEKAIEKGYTIALLTKDANNPRSRKTIKALQEVCHKNNNLFVVLISEGKLALEKEYTQYAITQKVDSMLIESSEHPLEIQKLLSKANIPGIFLNNEEKGICCEAVDEKKAGETMGEYLICKHHLIIRYLGADEALSKAHQEGIRVAYHNKKQPLDFALKMCDGTYLDIYEKLKEIFAEKIDLLILERDEMAIPLNKYLKEYHIAVPQNCSIISFGGHAITKVMSPTLTSLAFDYTLYAKYIYDTLNALMNNQKKGKMPQIYHIQNGDSIR